MLKNTTLMALIIILSLFISTTAYAASTVTYSLDDLGMSISIPDDLVTFTRDFDRNDPNIKAYGFTAETIESMMSSKNIFLNAWDEDVTFEIIVTMTSNPLNDFTSINDDILTAMASAFPAEYEKNGVTCIKTELYQNNQAKFIKIYISQPDNGSTAYGLQYYTVIDGKAINLILQSYSGQLSSTDEAYLKTIVDSTVFSKSTQAAETAATQTSSFTYTDSKADTTFTVPINWTETPVSEDNVFIKAKFIFNNNSADVILYGSQDTWSEMPEEDRAGYTRADFNNSIFTKDDVADIYGIAASEISTVIYNGIEYYKGVVTTTDSSLGFDLPVQTTRLLYINNGFIYHFQYAGTSSSKHYSDFEVLMNSVKYPEVKTTSLAVSTSDSLSGYTAGSILLGLLITVTVYSLPIAIYRYGIRRNPVDQQTAKKITIIYGICAFIAMCLIIYSLGGSMMRGGAIILWSIINYRMLIQGKPKQV